MKKKLLKKLLLVLLLFMGMTDISAHAVQVVYRELSNGYVRLYIEHWHGDLNFSTLSAVDGMNITTMYGSTSSTANVAPSGVANNTPFASLPGTGTGLTVLSSCAGANNNNDWVYYDFAPAVCGVQITITLNYGLSAILQEACADLYPVSFSKTFVDVLPPVITSPNVIVDSCIPASAVYTATAVDACDGSPIITYDIPSSSIFSLGTTPVTVTAEDNLGHRSSSIFNVIVGDITAPVVRTKNSTVQLDAAGNVSINAAQIDNGSSDACGIATLALNKTTFNCANAGANTVTLTVTDINGNVSSQTAIVTVQDKVAAVVLTKDITVQLDATGNVSITAAQINNGSSDACGIATLALDKTTFNCANAGANTVTLIVTDINGNVSSQTAIVTVQDKVAAVVRTKDITVQLDAAGNVSINAAQIDNGSSDACGIATLSVTPNTFTCANVGANTVTLTVRDVNGNSATGAATVTVKDEVKPLIIAQNVIVQLDNIGNGSTTAALVDNGSSDSCGIKSLVLSKTDFTCADIASNPNTVTLTVTDNNNNVSTIDATVTVKDEVTPVAIALNVIVQLDNTGNGSTTAALVDNGSNDSCGIKSLVLSKTDFTCADIANNPNTVTLTVTDNNNNVSTVDATVTVKDEVTPVAIAQNVIVQLDNTGNGSTTAALVDNGSNDSCGIKSLVLSKTDFTCADIASNPNTVTLTVTDNNDNVSTVNATITVEDKVAAVALTKDITVQLDAAGNVSITTTQIDNGSSDACGIATLTLDKTTFNCANVGANTVTLTTTDKNGNVATKTAIVTVEDKVAPVALTKNITVQLNAAGNVSIVAADVNNGSTDACGIAIMGLDKTTFSCANVGANTVTLTVTDKNGNVAAKTAIVTVEDKVAPVVLTKDITIQLNAAGNVAIVAANVNNGSTDACGIATLILDKISFTCANVGANTVTLTVTDKNGNVATKTAIVTVEDKIAPLVLTKNITVQLDASANISIVVADINNGSTDNCGISLLELDKTLFSCANVGANTVTLKVTDKNGNVSYGTATVTVVNSQPNLIRKHFDDVIFFDNSSNSFKAYSWYKNGVLVPSQTAQYFKDSGVLNGTYYAKATKTDGIVVTTCPLTFSPSVEVEFLKIAPNPVRSNSVYQLITNVESAKLQNAHIMVYSMAGTLMMDKVISGNAVEMIAPSVDGIYIVKMTLANGKYFTKNLLVKN